MNQGWAGAKAGAGAAVGARGACSARDFRARGPCIRGPCGRGQNGAKEGEGRLAETRDAGADRWGGGGLVALKDSEVRLLQEQVDKLRRQLLKNYEVTALREEIIAQLQVSFASFVVLFCGLQTACLGRD